MNAPAAVHRRAVHLRERLTAAAFAHRGLWSPGGAPENSLAAFRAAADAGYGVELDVRLAADGVPVVFHDATLERMTGEPGTVGALTAAALGRLRLRGSHEPIPTLDQALDAVAGRGLVLVELKFAMGSGDAGDRRLDQAAAAVLDRTDAPVAIIGFDLASHAWWRDHRPNMPRGLSSYGYDDAKATALPAEERELRRALEPAAALRPHFLALGQEIAGGAEARRLRAGGLPVVAWTARSKSDAARLAPMADAIIFEGFRP